jgi:hypothetical protein
VPLTEPPMWSPGDAVVLTGSDGTGTSLQCRCPQTNFAASPEAARALLAAVPAAASEVLSMPEAIARGREAFGGLLEHAAKEAQHADPDRA